MHPLVRDLYKRFIHVGRGYPGGLEYIRPRVKKAFFDNKDITDEVELKRAVNKGRYMVREMEATIQLKKYRTMKKRYGG